MINCTIFCKSSHRLTTNNYSLLVLYAGLVFKHVRWILNEQVTGLRDEQLKRQVVGHPRQQTVHKRHLTHARQNVRLAVQHNLQHATTPPSPPPSAAAAQRSLSTSTVITRAVKKAAHTPLPSVGFRSWSRSLAVSLQVTWVINLLAARPAVTPATLKGAAKNFAAWWTEARWVWTVCLRLLPDSVVTAIWTRALLRLSPAP